MKYYSGSVYRGLFREKLCAIKCLSSEIAAAKVCFFLFFKKNKKII